MRKSKQKMTKSKQKFVDLDADDFRDNMDFTTNECAMMSRGYKPFDKRSTEAMVTSSIPQTNIDKIIALNSLQTTAGYFKEDNIVESIKKFAVVKNECFEKNIATNVWLTALIIAYLEKNFSDEKDTWELIVGKARDWLGKTDVIHQATEILMD